MELTFLLAQDAAAVNLPALWLPIVVAAVVVFIASFLEWVVLPHHKPDFKRPPNETDLLGLIRDKGIGAGQYMFPYCGDWSEMKDPEKKKRYEAGPHGLLCVWPGPPNMAQNMLLSLIVYLLVAVFVGYLATLTPLTREADFLAVFRFTGAAGVLAYTFGFLPGAIWFRSSPRATVMNIIDAVVNGLLVGVVFGLLWP
jgi:hypothetical protein